jgi:uncharacterized protein
METSDSIERRILDFEIRVAKDDGPKKIIGYSAVFNQETDLGWFREKIARGAFADSIKADDIRALFNHDPNFVLGRIKPGTLTLREDEKGLWMEATLPDTQQARDVMELIERGDVTGQSFSFRTLKESWEYGKTMEDPDIRTLEKVQLFDVGPVTFPAYDGTRVDARAYQTEREERMKRQHESPVTRRRCNIQTQLCDIADKLQEVEL